MWCRKNLLSAIARNNKIGVEKTCYLSGHVDSLGFGGTAGWGRSLLASPRSGLRPLLGLAMSAISSDV